MHDMFFEIHSGLPREAPGSDASTRRALSTLPGVPDRPAILDLGCGPGAHTLVLAAESGGTVTAVDLHEPFLEELERRAEQEGLSDHISILCADMSDLEVDQPVDLIWSEGAIYAIGFAKGLQAWRPLVRPGGHVAVSHLTWFDRSGAPEAMRDFWDEAYPEMTTVEANLEMLAEAGYEPVDHFVQPDSDWETYYDPIRERLAQLRREHANDPEALEALDAERREIEMVEQNDGYFEYVFYLMERPARG